MPTYEYQCQACKHRFETWQKMTDEPLTTCPECGQHIRRVFHAAGIVFKGSGFYKTDHRSDSGVRSETAKTEGGSTTETSTAGDSKAANTTNASNGEGSSTKSESKPATAESKT